MPKFFFPMNSWVILLGPCPPPPRTGRGPQKRLIVHVDEYAQQGCGTRRHNYMDIPRKHLPVLQPIFVHETIFQFFVLVEFQVTSLCILFRPYG